MWKKLEYRHISFGFSQNIIGSKFQEIQRIIKEYKKNTGSFYCALIDVDGYLITTSESRNSTIIDSTLELYNSLELISRNCSHVIDFRNKVQVLSLYTEDDFKMSPNGVTILFKSIMEGMCLAAVYPSWIDPVLVKPQFVRLVKKITGIFKFGDRFVTLNMF